MAFITPRRRLLITAPLAIILPAGLIVYLGLNVVGVMEQTLGPLFSTDIQSHQQAVERFLLQEMSQRQREFGTALRLWIEERIYDGDDVPLQELDERFVLKLPLPFVRMIYHLDANGHLVFHTRDTVTDSDMWASRARSAALSAWVESPPPSADVVEALRAKLREDMALPLIRADWLEAEGGLVFVFRDQSEGYIQAANLPLRLDNDADRPATAWGGFVFDLDYVLNEILVPVILGTRLVTVTGSLTDYPLEVVDEENRIIATNAPNEPSRFARGYWEEQLSFKTFPFWRVRYAAESGLRNWLQLREIRAVTIPLIFSAVVIMIFAIVAYVRNLARELKLADMRSDFVARVSHELRTPLGLIRLFAETLEMERIDDQSRRREYLHTITRESERLSKLIDNVLDFSKIEAGQKQYQLTLGSVADVVEDVTDSMRFHMSRNNLELLVQTDPNLPMVRLDREAMAQALWNLLSNAVKYSGTGRVVEVETRRGDGEVVLDVRDQGIGIAPQEVKRICDQFYRVDDPRVRERGGSGLGLSVVKHIIDGHNGRLVIQSTPGVGSTFSLCLPIPSRPASSSTEAKDSGEKL